MLTNQTVPHSCRLFELALRELFSAVGTATECFMTQEYIPKKQEYQEKKNTYLHLGRPHLCKESSLKKLAGER